MSKLSKEEGYNVSWLGLYLARVKLNLGKKDQFVYFYLVRRCLQKKMVSSTANQDQKQIFRKTPLPMKFLSSPILKKFLSFPSTFLNYSQFSANTSTALTNLVSELSILTSKLSIKFLYPIPKSIQNGIIFFIFTIPVQLLTKHCFYFWWWKLWFLESPNEDSLSPKNFGSLSAAKHRYTRFITMFVSDMCQT